MHPHSTDLLVVLGATGFVGQHFLDAALREGKRVTALTRKTRVSEREGVRWVTGDMDDQDIWPCLLEPACTVVNLAYSSHARHGVNSVAAMIKACNEAGVARLIHCSTISVYGRSDGALVDEQSACRPIDEYGRHKLMLEKAVLGVPVGGTEVSVLRPAAIFGNGGLALRSLAESLQHGSSRINFLRSSLFGRRRMHLVSVIHVVSALLFLCNSNRSIDGEIFICSQDDDPLNNFRDVEKLLLDELHLPDYRISPLVLPRFILTGLLWARGRGDIDPGRCYSSKKLREWGFVQPVGFESALRHFIQSGFAGGG